jgi:hypothetical protein
MRIAYPRRRPPPFDCNHSLRLRAPNSVLPATEDCPGETASNMWQRFSTLVAFLTLWLVATDTRFRHPTLNYLFSIYKPCLANSALASFRMPLAGRLRVSCGHPGVLMAVACESVDVRVFQVGGAGQPQKPRFLPTNGQYAEVPVSATHSTQPSLSANNQSEDHGIPKRGRNEPS